MLFNDGLFIASVNKLLGLHISNYGRHIQIFKDNQYKSITFEIYSLWINMDIQQPDKI